MAFFMIFVGLLGYDFFRLFQKHLFAEVSSLLYLSSSHNAKMVHYFPLSDITVPHMDISDFSSWVFLLRYSYSCLCLV